MSEITEMEIPKHWIPKPTMRDVFALLVFAVGIGGWISDGRFTKTDHERQITELRRDVTRLQERLDQKDKADNQADKVIGMLEYRLGQIENKLTSIDTNMRRMAQ